MVALSSKNVTVVLIVQFYAERLGFDAVDPNVFVGMTCKVCHFS